MDAVILAGGFGTRLHPLTNTLPKPMLPILNQPFLEHYLGHLGKHGVNRAFLTLYHLPEMIQQHFGKSYQGISLQYAIEDEPLGTAGGIKKLQNSLQDTFLVGNGDIFTDVDLSTALKFHKETNASVTLVLTEVSDPTAFGMVETDTKSRITRFIEKPSLSQVTTHWVNGGTYILEPHVLSYLPSERPVMFERDLFPTLLANNEQMYAFKSDAYWLDMGTPRNYLQLHWDLLDGPIKSLILERDDNLGIFLGEDCHIHPNAILEGPILLGAGCHIGPYAQLTGPLVIGDRCNIGSRVQISNSVVWSESTLGPNSVLERCILGKAVTVGEGAQINADCILGSHATVAEGRRLPIGFSLGSMEIF